MGMTGWRMKQHPSHSKGKGWQQTMALKTREPDDEESEVACGKGRETKGKGDSTEATKQGVQAQEWGRGPDMHSNGPWTAGRVGRRLRQSTL
jgi:hypothetical protein